MIPRWCGLLGAALGGLVAWSELAADGFKAGVASVDISPPFLPVIRNGSFIEGNIDRVVDPLHVRAFVLEEDEELIAIAVVDSCMLPRDFCDQTKEKVREAVGIRPDRILLAATHTHSAPSVMNFCLGSRQDPRYALFLPGKIVEAIRLAFESRQPAEMASGRIDAGRFTKNRRWITHPDKLLEDPFGERTVRAMMHPGYSNPDFLGPSGPIDPWLTVLSLRTSRGKPLGVLANFSMHYFGGHPGASPDYYGEFRKQLHAALAPDDSTFMAAMSQGTSGDLWWGDYSLEQAQTWSIEEYSAGLVDQTVKLLQGLEYRDDITLQMVEKRMVLGRRVPNDARLEWAEKKLAIMDGQRPRNRPEVYAEQARFIRNNPKEEVVLQVIRVGDLAMTAMPNEVYALTGLKLKSMSPLATTMNLSLANGAAGYIPPPEQHELGGYTTWPARTAGLVVAAEPTIVTEIGKLFSEVSDDPARQYYEPVGNYAESVLQSKPAAYWRMGDQQRLQLDRADGLPGDFEDAVALHLPGVEGRGFGSRYQSRAAQFVGGRFVVPEYTQPDTYTLEFWFKSYVPANDWNDSSTLFAWGADRLKLQAEKDGSARLVWGTKSGKSVILPKQWNHVVVVRQPNRARVYLNGVRPTEIVVDWEVDRSGQLLSFAAGLAGEQNFEGKLDEIAFYRRALSLDEIQRHFRAAGREESAALSPAESMARTHVRPGYELELVAAEPLVKDPVAIDWGIDGRLWVAEMADYPYGMDGAGAPGGRVRFLIDSDHDGQFDQSQVFLDGINFPTSVMPWRSGVLVAAAPEILYAEDQNGDGRADAVEVLYRGFMEGNQQLRVNSFRWGLDGWIYCASGGHHAGFGAKNAIEALRAGQTIPLGSRDFRFQVDSGVIQPLSGPSQFGRVRDDWGRWFGVQNSYPLWHFVLSDPYLQRNQNVVYPDPRRQMRSPRNPKVFMNKSVQKRYHSFEQSSRFTSACGPSIYRDEWLFSQEPGVTHAFTCEPFHNVVQHHVLTADGVSFQGRRADEDGPRDFFASADRWCRPVMTRTGPDGALYVVDMYRYMIEHPDWLPAEGREELKPFYRSGEAMGRIFRIVPKHPLSNPLEQSDLLTPNQCVAALNSPNGRVRDLAQQRLIELTAREVAPDLQGLVRNAGRAATRGQALATLFGLNQLSEKDLVLALQDESAEVRRLAVRFAEGSTPLAESLRVELLNCVNDPDAKVRLQLALSLGQWPERDFAEALRRLAVHDRSDAFAKAAIGSSLETHFDAVADALLELPEFVQAVVQTAATNPNRREQVLRLIVVGDSVHWAALAAWLNVSDALGIDWRARLQQRNSSRPLVAAVDQALTHARVRVAEVSAKPESRREIIPLLGRASDANRQDVQLLVDLVSPQNPISIRHAAIRRLRRLPDTGIGQTLLSAWKAQLPQDREMILDLLLSREVWSRALLDAVERQDVSAVELDAARREQLRQHRNADLAARATRLLRVTTQTRATVEQHYRASLKEQGSSDRGRELFIERCGLCHELGDVGRAIGPDLRSVTNQSAADFLNSIVRPNLAIEPRYLGYNVHLKDGDSIMGMIERETAGAITVRTLDGTERTVLRQSVERVESTDRSLMPEGLEAEMTITQMADLLSFLVAETSNN